MSEDGKKKGFGASLVKGFGMAKQFTMQKMGKAQATEEPVAFRHQVGQMKLSTGQLREVLNRTIALVKSHRAAITQYQGFGGSVARLLQSHDEKTAPSKEDTSGKRLSVVDSPIGHISTNFHPYSLQIIGHRERLVAAYETILIAPLEELLNNECAQAAKLVSKLDVDRLDYDAKQSKVDALKEKGKNVESADAHAADVAKHTYEATVTGITEKCKAIDVKKHGIMTQNLLQIQKAEQDYYSAASASLSSQLSGASIAMVAVPASATSVEDDYNEIIGETDTVR